MADAEKKPGELLRSFLTDPLSYIPHPDQVDFVSVDDLLADLDAALEAAWRKGAEEMRERAARSIDCDPGHPEGCACCEDHRESIRSLPTTPTEETR